MTPARFGMVGGGPGAFIGAVHRTALALDGLGALVAGAFSSDPEKSRAFGAGLGLNPARVYPGFEEMARREAALQRDERIDAAIIVTPNHVHEPAASAFLRAGIPVICDKPLAATLEQAKRLHALAQQTGVPLIVTYNYTGYPLVRHARELVLAGELGPIRKLVVQYHQGWLASALEREGHKQAGWRTDPAQAGAGALGDIGSHAENLACFITGMNVTRLAADVSSLVPARRVDDDAGVLLRLRGPSGDEARALLSVSQVCVGRENDLSIQVYGEHGSLDWRQENPNELRLALAGKPATTLTRATVPGAAVHATRLPPGHPEGFYEAFANIYKDAIDRIAAWRDGRQPAPSATLLPTSHEGLRGLKFIHACQRSAAQSGAWVIID